MANDFTSALTSTITNEGTRVDRGNVGNRGNSLYGVTQKTWNEYTKKLGLPSSKVENLKPQQVALFYKDYFRGTGIENLPPKMYKQVFDYGVQSGATTSVMALQKLVGAKPDGQIGPQTLQAIAAYSDTEDRLPNDYLNLRRDFLLSLVERDKKNPPPKGKASHAENEKGYKNRIEAMRNQISPR
jgi:lysozyme family protein